MIRKIVACLLMLSLCSGAFSATSLPKYEPYGENEFPEWSKKLRRAEVITFGATAITYPLVGLFLKTDDSKMDGFFLKFGIAAAAGAVIALIDYIIGEAEEDSNAKKGGIQDEPVVVLAPDSAEAQKLDELRKAALEAKEKKAEDVHPSENASEGGSGDSDL